jgi:acyl-coenzyme A synthetase/AMP-(fatty) acid ligase
VDHIVKRRGVKVSLPSLEAAALELPDVDSAAAVDYHRSQAPGDSSTVIVLFCGMSAGVGPDSLRRVRAGLVDRLDLAAMPDLIRLLPELPLDNRGKVDRAVLRARTATLAGERGRI